jgi:two-component system sensor histidine kinase DctS
MKILRHALQALLNALWSFFKSVTRSFTDRRVSLWFALVGLVLALLVTLVWLAGRYEASQYQAELDRDTGDAVSDIRRSLTNHALSLQSLNAKSLGSKYWRAEVASLMSQNREWLRAERRDLQNLIGDAVNSPLRANPFSMRSRGFMNKRYHSNMRPRQTAEWPRVLPNLFCATSQWHWL